MPNNLQWFYKMERYLYVELIECMVTYQPFLIFQSYWNCTSHKGKVSFLKFQKAKVFFNTNLVHLGSTIRSLDYNPNKQYYLATGGDDGSLMIWDYRAPSGIQNIFVVTIVFLSMNTDQILQQGSKECFYELICYSNIIF